MFQNLQPQLEKILPEAKNVYIATALIKKYGYDIVEKLLPVGCKRYYLLGINLPSDASVFRRMMATPEASGGSRIYKGAHTYHPKVYLIELQTGNRVAFVGSANTTNGGLSTNVEMSLKTDDQDECAKIYDWFQKLYGQAGELTEEFINSWQRTTKDIEQRQSANRADVAALKSLLKSTQPNVTVTVGAGQFFKASHYEAYHKVNWEDYSDAADQRRRGVRSRFKLLHEQLYRQFAYYGLNELHDHYHAQSRISHYMYRRGWTNHLQRSMWLHYGYGRKDFSKTDSFGNHPRVQVILHEDSIGIWLVVGVHNGSSKERHLFKENLRNTPFFDDLIYKHIRELGNSYWLDVNSKSKNVSDFPDATSLKMFLLPDDTANYFIIGRTFSPDDDSLTEAIIAETVLQEFQRLYPLYILLKHLS